MATYRLLRNNKETGPHSLEELKNMGLKAYDLVWVDGRSAAWRYPGEIDELKSFSPGVEEQPFDRFFKKKPVIEKQPDPVAQQPAIVEESFAVAPEHEKYIPQKSVFVALPHKKTEPPRPPAGAERQETTVQQTISVTENPVAATAEIKYSQPLDEIKEMYVKTLYDRKQKIARKHFWLQNLRKAAVILLLVAVGVAGGLLIRTGGKGSTSIAAAEKEPGSKIASPAIPDLPSVVNRDEIGDTDATEVAGRQSDAGMRTTDVPGADDTYRKLAGSSNQGLLPKAQLPAPDHRTEESNSPTVVPEAALNPVSGERSKRTRGDKESGSEPERQVKSFPSGDVSSLVSVSSNEYKKVAFGGIRNLELTVTNDSKYTLDHVLVELQYIKPNELPLKTEKVEFKSIGPKSASTIRIPDTNRGIRVTYRIINIRSSQMDEVAAGN